MGAVGVVVDLEHITAQGAMGCPHTPVAAGIIAVCNRAQTGVVEAQI